MAPKFALAAILGLQAASMAAAHPTVRDANDILIVGGDEAEAGEFPFIVSLSSPVYNGHFCGGSLLNANTVLTAAHCTSDMEASEIKVRAGSNKWASGGKQVEVSKILVHPEYEISSTGYDVSLLHLKSPIETGENIDYVGLPDAGSDPAANSTVTVAGWGDLEDGSGQGSPDLMKVSVPIVGRETCDAQYSKDGGSGITDTMICAGAEEGGKDACQMDSGGPLVDDKTGDLVGVVSWGNGCAKAGYAGVYARVGKFIPWIADNLSTS